MMVSKEREQPVSLNKSATWLAAMALSFIIALAILVLRPLQLNMPQAIVVSAVVLTIAFWSFDLVNKNCASVFLLVILTLFSDVHPRVVFAFTLSETFPMIVLTYLFSQAISNSEIIDNLCMPLLTRYVRTVDQFLLSVVVLFYTTIYLIPQPLARLIIVSVLYQNFLMKSHIRTDIQRILIYAVYLLYAVVNVSSKDADIIMNYVAVEVSGSTLSNATWVRDMFIPAFLSCILIVFLFKAVFRKELSGFAFEFSLNEKKPELSKSQKVALMIIGLTILGWIAGTYCHVNSTIVTFLAIVALYGFHILKPSDLKSIDWTTLLFLTAAFSIGGTMKACGAANKIFAVFTNIFPDQPSLAYLLVIITVTVFVHLFLGSNTTTLSVVVPGLVILCGKMIPIHIIIYLCILAVSYHAILPFHSVAMMIGVSNHSFPARYVTRIGIPMTVLIYLMAAFIFIPYWKLIGLF